MTAEKLKILIAAGGTGGHVFPGVAIAEAVARENNNAEIVFVGTENGPEAKLVPEAGWPIKTLGEKSVHGGGLKNHLRTLVDLPRTIWKASALIKEQKPDVIVGTGGFATAPVLIAAMLCGVPAAIVEPNAIAGRSNRLLSHFVRRVYVGFEVAAKSFSRKKVYITGIPIRAEISSLERKQYDGSGPMTVLCYGGSQGARRLNEIMVDAVGYLKHYADKLKFIHQVGKATSVEEVANVYRHSEFESEVFVFTEKMADLYAEADIAIVRSGAGTVAETSAVKLPTILVPLPNSVDDHQRANAKELVRIGGAIMMEEPSLTGESLARVIVGFLENPNRLTMMSEALGKTTHSSAAQKIASDCLKMAGVN